jgi:Fic family protein
MSRFAAWANSREALAWDPVVRAIAAHFYLISIHPFGDGNGRTSRAVESYILYRGGINVVGFYSLANFYYKNRARYVEMLDHARFQSQGNLTAFILFGLKGLREELNSVTTEVVSTLARITFRDYAREMLLGEDGPGQKVGMRRFMLFGVILDTDEFLRPSRRSFPSALQRAYRGLTQRTIQRDVAALMESGLIRVGEGDVVRPNLELMEQFTPKGLQRKATSGDHPR